MTPQPPTVTVRRPDDGVVQVLELEADGALAFRQDGEPVLGMGGGGPRPQRGMAWREQPVEFDRRGRLHAMEPRWQANMYCSEPGGRARGHG